MSYPIQPGKVQAPALRDETLARTRLLDWLESKIHGRVVFVIADAGYGKTTLLADFSRRTRLRTIWYRLDEDDRDWVGFLSHLVAAGREHEPEFAPRTAAMLRSLEPGGPTRDDAIAMFVRELPSIVVDGGAALIFDDFHLADEVNDVRLTVREILAKAPERLSIVFASRRQPPVPVSKLRAIGELAELGISDLRFSDSELEQLFRETYNRPLEPDVLTELAKRTEGWAASLTLVQAALRERSPAETRSFVRGLSGARDELHDYLAEEVVGDLPQIHQEFLMRTSVLQVVTPELAQVATGLEAVEVQSLMLESERLGLLGRRPNRRSSAQRYHPLVREFLEERLLRAIGQSGVEQLHIAVARWAESTDWRTAAHHFASAKLADEVLRVLSESIELILASGAYAAADEFLKVVGDARAATAVEIIKSRAASLTGDADLMERHAIRAVELEPDSDIATFNLISASYLIGNVGRAIALAERLASKASSPLVRELAEASRLNGQVSLRGSLAGFAEHLERLADRNRAEGHDHYEGVSRLNLAQTLRAMGEMDRSFKAASEAVDTLRSSSSGVELMSAEYSRASAIAWRGDIETARQVFRRISSELRNVMKAEFHFELADLEAELGDARIAQRSLRLLSDESRSQNLAEIALGTEALVRLRLADSDGALRALDSADLDLPTAEPGRLSRLRALRCLVVAVREEPGSLELAREASAFAASQQAGKHQHLATLVAAAMEGALAAEIIATPRQLIPNISVAAELIARHLSVLDVEALERVEGEAVLRPDRWLPTLRAVAADRSDQASRLAAARLLDRTGTFADIPLLRKLAHEPRRIGSDRLLGKRLARRLAPKAGIADLGRVRVLVGDREVSGAEIRRKVMALLCFLLSKPKMTATREEVMEALWPGMEPAAAINSLNQAVYFLRRVFETDYEEDLSPGYVHQESDLIYLDNQLVESSSSRCAALIGLYDKEATPDVVDALSVEYVGRFAADFAYEDWAADYRDWLHVAYLQIVETEIANEVARGRYDRPVALARRALEVDPRLDSLGLSLLKVLKGSGAHSAAAEQYERYAGLLQSEIGVEAPPYDSI